MQEKQKVHSWKGVHTVIAVIAMLTQLVLCNIFAGVDRQRLAKKASPTELQPLTPMLITGPTPAKTCQTIITKRNLGAKCVTRTRSS